MGSKGRRQMVTRIYVWWDNRSSDASCNQLYDVHGLMREGPPPQALLSGCMDAQGTANAHSAVMWPSEGSKCTQAGVRDGTARATLVIQLAWYPAIGDILSHTLLGTNKQQKMRRHGMTCYDSWTAEYGIRGRGQGKKNKNHGDKHGF